MMHEAKKLKPTKLRRLDNENIVENNRASQQSTLFVQ